MPNWKLNPESVPDSVWVQILAAVCKSRPMDNSIGMLTSTCRALRSVIRRVQKTAAFQLVNAYSGKASAKCLDALPACRHLRLSLDPENEPTDGLPAFLRVLSPGRAASISELVLHHENFLNSTTVLLLARSFPNLTSLSIELDNDSCEALRCIAHACPQLERLKCGLITLHADHSAGLSCLTSLRQLELHAMGYTERDAEDISDFASLQGCLAALTGLTNLCVKFAHLRDSGFSLGRLSGLSQLCRLQLKCESAPFALSCSMLAAMTALRGLEHLGVDGVAEGFSIEPADVLLPALTGLQFLEHSCTASPPKLDLLQAAALAERCPSLRAISGCRMELWEALDGDPACLRSGLQALTSLHARGLLCRPFAHLPADFFAEVRSVLCPEELRPLRHMDSLHVRELARADVAWLVALAPHLEHLEASPDALPVLAPLVSARLRTLDLVPWGRGHVTAPHMVARDLAQLKIARPLAVRVTSDLMSEADVRLAAVCLGPYGLNLSRK